MQEDFIMYFYLFKILWLFFTKKVVPSVMQIPYILLKWFQHVLVQFQDFKEYFDSYWDDIMNHSYVRQANGDMKSCPH